MSAIAVPPPIPGEPIDPPPKTAPGAIKTIDEKDGVASATVGVGYRAIQRFTYAKAGLLAAGTTYYLFLAMFSIAAFGYGLVAILGADQMASHLTDALENAFPGVVGDDGIDPQTLKAVGRTTSVVGLVALLWAGGGAMAAASGSLHQIYGAAPDPRNFVKSRARLLGWMLVFLPLVAFSYATTTVVASYAGPILDDIGLDSTIGRIVLVAVAVALALAVDFLILYLLLGHLGGIRPDRRPRLIGSLVGAVLIEFLKYFMATIVAFSVDKPEYGALAAPIGILLILYLQCMAAYGAASLAAGIAEKEVPLEDLAPDVADSDHDPKRR
ncbi:MAG: YhjD/YihY/BrkB family envelope integrity protein, partial [Actinomycetes bacterium]|jgi:membrane protein